MIGSKKFRREFYHLKKVPYRKYHHAANLVWTQVFAQLTWANRQVASFYPPGIGASLARRAMRLLGAITSSAAAAA